MHDDERRLAERLRRYESRIPVKVEAPVVVRPNRVPMWALGAVAAALVGVAILASNLVTDDRQVGEISPSPSPTSAPTTDPSGSRPDTGMIAAVELQDAGRRLFLVFGGYMRSCTDYQAETNVAGDVLEVLVTPTEEVISCRLALVERTLTVALNPPFTGTAVRDLATGELFPVGVAAVTATPAPSATPAATPAPATGVAGVAWATDPAAVVPGSVSRITAVDGRFYALGSFNDGTEVNAAVWSSDDALTWRLAVLPFPQALDPETSSARASNLASVDGQLIALGSGGIAGLDDIEPVVWSSTDGQTWTELDTGSFRTHPIGPTDVTNGPGGLVLTTSHVMLNGRDSVWRSSNGARTWTEQRPPDTFFVTHAVVGTRNGYLLAGASVPGEQGGDPRPRIWRSDDGADWELVDLEGSGNLGDVEHLTVDGTGTWVALGNLDGRAVVWRSTDEQHWTLAADLGPSDFESRPDARLAGVPDGFIAVVDAAPHDDEPIVTWTSHSGLTWTSASSALESGLPAGSQLYDGFATGIARIGGAVVIAGTLDGSDDPTGEWAVWIGEVQR